MDEIESLAKEIQVYCAANADPAMAAKYARYFKEGYDAWGLMGKKDDPFWNELQEEWLDRYAGLKLRGFLQLGEKLIPSGKYEETAIAIRFLVAHLDEFNTRTFAGLGKWFAAGIANWAHTDVICNLVIAPMIADGRIKLKAMAKWRQSEYKYQRRAVPVGMLDPIKTGAEPEPPLEFVRPLMMDPERVVQQGLGWFLRELWKKHPELVEALLLEYKDDAPRTIFQYATEKMPKQHRARFRREKKR